MKKTDIGLIIIVVVFAIVLQIFNVQKFFVVENQTLNVLIRVDGKLYETHPLDVERMVRVNTDVGFNDIQIKNGEVTMFDADCNDLICVKTKSINRQGQSIICLPHRVSVEIKGTYEEEREVDDISQ